MRFDHTITELYDVAVLPQSPSGSGRLRRRRHRARGQRRADV